MTNDRPRRLQVLGFVALVAGLVSGLVGCYGPTGPTTKAVTFSCQASSVAPHPQPIERHVQIRTVAPAWSVRGHDLPLELQVTGLTSIYDTGSGWYVIADIELAGMGPIVQAGKPSWLYWMSETRDSIGSTTPVDLGTVSTKVTAAPKSKGTLAITSLRIGSVLDGHGVGENCTPVGGKPIVISVESR